MEGRRESEGERRKLKEETTEVREDEVPREPSRGEDKTRSKETTEPDSLSVQERTLKCHSVWLLGVCGKDREETWKHGMTGK